MKKPRVFTLGVACFFCAVIGLGVVPITSGGGGVLGDNHAGLSASAGTLTPQEKLLAGTLELDPENDPVVYTTDYGLDIRWHMAGLPNNPNDIASVPGGQKLETYAYFTHADVNWVIIGCSDKPSTISTGTLNLGDVADYYNKAGYYNFSNSSSGIWEWFANGRNTAAGSALFSDYLNKGKDVIYNLSSQTISQNAVFPNAAATDELEFDEVLCFAQNRLSTTSKFNDSTSAGNCYYNSRLMTTINTFYDTNLIDLDSKIVPKTLKTVWAGAPDTTNGSNLEGTYKLFPLAGASANESFYVLNYLTSGSAAMQQSGIYWWLRSGYAAYPQNAYYVYTTGVLNKRYDAVTYSTGVRPAFVLQI